MAAVTSYATLTTRLSETAERPTYTAGQTDGFIADAEAEFRLYLGPHFSKEVAAATLTVTAGSATLPTGLVRVLSTSHATYGQLTFSSIAAVRARRLYDTGAVPALYAITGATILTGPLYTGNLTLDYEGTLTGLSSGNPSNWLVTYAPQAYVHMCMSFAKLDEEDYQGAAIRKAAAMKVLDDLSIQSMVMQQGRAEVTIPGMTP